MAKLRRRTPRSYATRCRATLGVLVQLFVEAEENVVIAAPFIQPDVLETGALRASIRAALEREISIDLLGTKDDLSKRATRRLLTSFGPKLRLYHPAFPEFRMSRLGSHAKFCISDDKAAYIGSANLTNPGLSKHFELGVLVRGRVAASMRAFWNFAVHYRLFAELTDS